MTSHISSTLTLVRTVAAPPKESPLTRCAGEVGLPPSHLRDYLRHARWTPEKFHSEVKQPDWWDRLKHDARERELDRRVSDVGPAGFCSLTDEQILAKLPPKLHRWVETYDGRSALLTSPTGTGDSIAAFCVLRRLARAAANKELSSNWEPYGHGHGDGPRRDPEANFCSGWISADDLLNAHRGHPLGRGEAPEVRKAKNHRPVLVLDDITRPRNDDVTREVLWSRYDRGLPVIVTAGMPRPQLMARFRDATYRRFLGANGERGTVVDHFAEGGK